MQARALSRHTDILDPVLRLVRAICALTFHRAPLASIAVRKLLFAAFVTPMARIRNPFPAKAWGTKP